MAALTADEIKRIEQAFTMNRRDGNLVDKVINSIDNTYTQCAGVTYTVGAEDGSDIIIVSCQFTDQDGDDMAYRIVVQQWLSTDDTGETLEAAATALVAGTDGAILVEDTTDAIWTAVTEADGDLDISVRNAGGADTLYLNTQLPNGKVVSQVLTFA